MQMFRASSKCYVVVDGRRIAVWRDRRHDNDLMGLLKQADGIGAKVNAFLRPRCHAITATAND